MLIFAVISCKPDPSSKMLLAPTALSPEVTNITRTTAFFSGSYSSELSIGIAEVGFYYGTAETIADGIKISISPSEVKEKKFSKEIAGLSMNTKYNVWSFISSGKYEAISEVFSFSTKSGEAPAISTIEVTKIGSSIATCGGSVIEDGGGDITARGVCWSTSENPTVSLATKTVDGSGLGDFISQITGLTAETTYYVRAYATNSFGTQYGEQRSFKTGERLITLAQMLKYIEESQETKSEISHTFIDDLIVRGRVTANSSTINENSLIFIQEITAIDTSGVAIILQAASKMGQFTIGDEAEIALMGGKLYYDNDILKFKPVSDEKVSKTSAENNPPNPVIIKDLNYLEDYESIYVEVSGVFVNSSSEGEAFNSGTTGNNGKITMNYISGGETKSFIMFTHPGASWKDEIVPDSKGTLKGVVGYYNSMFCIQPQKKEDVEGLKSMATVEILNIKSLTYNSAVFESEVTKTGGSDIKNRGICWSTSENPTLNDSKIDSGEGKGKYESTITDLTENTLYYVRPYATNAKGTAYGEQKRFKTKRENMVYIDLSAAGTANCYIISNTEEEFYSINATIIGNGQQGIISSANFHTSSAFITPQSAGLLWQDVDNLVYDIELSSDGESILFASSGSEGNAVIAAYSGKDCTGDILWSWHIWNTDVPMENNYKNYEGKSFILMDRNLGATSSLPGANDTERLASYGVYYQWGRKDPFPGASGITSNSPRKIYGDSAISSTSSTSSTGTLSYVVKNPMTFITVSGSDHDWYYGTSGNNYLWGNNSSSYTYTIQKTIYDPCPQGYVVPPIDMWTGFTSTGKYSTTASEFNVSGSFDKGWHFYIAAFKSGLFNWYPATGLIRNDISTYSGVGVSGFLWMNTTFTLESGRFSYFFGYESGDLKNANYGNYAAFGQAVRCVKESSIPHVSVPGLASCTITDVSISSAKASSKIESEGNLSVTERGFCWSTDSNPTISDNKITSTSTTSDFSSIISGLKSETTYYIRSYATNSIGTGYGAVSTFTTLKKGNTDGDNEDLDINDGFEW